MQLIMRHQATTTWNEGSRKSSREKIEASSKDRQDAVWVLDQVQEQLMQYLLQDSYKRDIGEYTGRELWWAFVDLEKAFDRVPRKVVEWAMRKLDVEEWLERAVMAMYKHARTRIRSYGG